MLASARSRFEGGELSEDPPPGNVEIKMANLIADVRHALRQLLRRPVFTTTAILTPGTA
jgi:hypothetical protein